MRFIRFLFIYLLISSCSLYASSLPDQGSEEHNLRKTLVNIIFENSLLSVAEMRGSHPSLNELEIGHPTCFLSYAWGNSAHESLVHGLAAHLRLAGVLVKLDIDNNKGGTEISRFTEEVGKSDFVLLAGSLKLMEKYNTTGSVVNLEIGQIFQKQKNKPGSVIPLVLEGRNTETLPPFLHNVVYIGFQDPVAYGQSVFDVIERLYQLESQDMIYQGIVRDFQAQKKALEGMSYKKLRVYKEKMQALQDAEQAQVMGSIEGTLAGHFASKSAQLAQKKS